MSSIINKVKDAIASKSDGMSGMGTDQGALQDQSMNTDESKAKYEEDTAKYGTANKSTSTDMSGVGVDQSALGDDNLEKYESQYGKADESFAKDHGASRDMSGVGVDQSKLFPKES